LSTIILALYNLLDLISWVIVIKSFLTWIQNETTEKIYNILSIFTEPIEAPIRKLTQNYMTGPVDFTPMIAILFIMVLKNIVLYLL